MLALPIVSDDEIAEIRLLPPRLLTRASLPLVFIQQRRVNENWRSPRTFIPAQLARPTWAVCTALGRPPILIYAQYALENRRVRAKELPLSAENVVMLQHFNSPEFPERFRSEEWFIAIHIEIEKTAGLVVEAALMIDQALRLRDYDTIRRELPIITQGFSQMRAILSRMEEHCIPEVYYEHVRPYLFGWSVVPQGVRYEGIPDPSFDEPKRYRGQTGAQSSIAPLLDIVLGIFHDEADDLSIHLKEMLELHTPKPHRELLLNLREHFLRNVIRWSRMCALNMEIREEYRKARLALANFRVEHYRQATVNIARFTKRERLAGSAVPKGTGGTNFMESLKKHIRDTLYVDDTYRFHLWEKEWKALHGALL